MALLKHQVICDKCGTVISSRTEFEDATVDAENHRQVHTNADVGVFRYATQKASNSALVAACKAVLDSQSLHHSAKKILLAAIAKAEGR